MATTQEVLDSTKVLQDRVASEGVTDNAGNVLQAPISSTTLAGSPGSVVLPTPNNTQPPVVPAPDPVTPVDPLAQAQADYLKSIQAPETDTAGQYAQANTAAGIPGMETQVNDLSAQLNAINANAQAAQQQLESSASGKDITTSFLGRQQQEIGRQAAIKGLPIAAALSAAQGRLTSAQTHLDKLFEFKTADAKAKMDYNNKLAETVYGFASDAEKRKLDASIRKETRDDATATANRTEQASYAKTALESGQTDLMSQISALDEKSPTFKADLAKLTKQIKESPTAILDRQLKAAQIEASKASTAASNASAAKIIAETPSTVTNASTKEKSIAQLDFLTKTAKEASDLSKHAGPGGAAIFLGDLTKGDTGYRQLEAKANTLKVNVLSLMTDPTIKKFFGPQMSNADVELMTSAGTTLNPEKNSPADIKAEIGRLTDLFTRMKQAIVEGSVANDYLDSTVEILDKNATGDIYSNAGYPAVKQ